MAVHVVHPHVTQVEASFHTLSFYYDQQAEIDADLDANREEYVRRRLTGEDPSLPR